MRACAHFLRREVTGWGPHQSLHQLAYDSAVPAVANAAHEWTKDNHLPTLYQTGGEVISFIGSTVFEGHDDDVSGAIGLRNGRILSWSKDRTLRLWDPDTGAAVTPPLSNHTDWVGGAIELSDGRILSWSWDSSLQFWDPETGAALGPPLEGHTDSVFGTIELHDGRILSWAADHTLRLWDSDSGVSLGPPLQGHTNCVGGAVQLRNGHILSWPGHRPYRFQDTLRLSLDGLGRSGKPFARLQRTGSTDTTLRLWDPDAGTAVGGALEGHTRRIGGVIELHDGRILSWADDGTLRLWDPDTGATLGSALEGSPDGACGALELRHRRILSWVRDKELQLWEFQLWDSDTGTASDPPLVDAAVEDYKVSALELLDGRVLTWSVDPEAIRVWNPDAGIESGLALGGHCDTIHGVTELRDGRILSWSEDRTLRLWDPNTGSATPLDGHSDDVSGALEISDGRILSWSEDHTLRLWDCPTGTAAAQALEGHSGYASDALWLRSGSILWWSPDRRWLRLWDPESCTAGPLLEGHPRRVSGALELRDTRILSWSEDGTLQLWNPDTGAAIGRPLKGHTNGVTGALELRNGRILSWSYDNTLRVWHGDGSIDIPPFEGHTRDGHRSAGAPRRPDPLVVRGRDAPMLGPRHWDRHRASVRGPLDRRPGRRCRGERSARTARRPNSLLVEGSHASVLALLQRDGDGRAPPGPYGRSTRCAGAARRPDPLVGLGSHSLALGGSHRCRWPLPHRACILGPLRLRVTGRTDPLVVRRPHHSILGSCLRHNGGNAPTEHRSQMDGLDAPGLHLVRQRQPRGPFGGRSIDPPCMVVTTPTRWNHRNGRCDRDVPPRRSHHRQRCCSRFKRDCGGDGRGARNRTAGCSTS